MSNTIAPSLPESTAAVCHDAGAGNVVIAGLLEAGRNNWRAYMQGPSEKIWKEAFPEIALCETLNTALDQTEFLITGTGWSNILEHTARKLARSRGIRSAAVVDHWVNYAERFTREGETVWPDEFWVTDTYAMDIAKSTFPGQIVRQVPNYYLNTQLNVIAAVENNVIPELLYVLEPIRSNWGKQMPGEFQALDYFIDHLSLLGLPPDTLIRLRPHPSDSPDKYNSWISRHPDLNLQIDHSVSIGESIGRSSWVAGCESFAMVLALMADRQVYCTLPPWAPACRLPHNGLIHLSKQDSGHRPGMGAGQ